MEIEITHNTVHMLVITPCCTSKPSLPNIVLLWKWTCQTGECGSRNYIVLCGNVRKRVGAFFKGTKENCRSHAVTSWDIMMLSYVIAYAAVPVLECLARNHHRYPCNAMENLSLVLWFWKNETGIKLLHFKRRCWLHPLLPSKTGTAWLLCLLASHWIIRVIKGL